MFATPFYLGLIDEVCKTRGLDPTTAVVRVGMDGGQGSFKVVMNIYDPADNEHGKHGDKYKNTGKFIIYLCVGMKFKVTACLGQWIIF